MLTDLTRRLIAALTAVLVLSVAAPADAYTVYVERYWTVSWPGNPSITGSSYAFEPSGDMYGYAGWKCTGDPQTSARVYYMLQRHTSSGWVNQTAFEADGHDSESVKIMHRNGYTTFRLSPIAWQITTAPRVGSCTLMLRITD